MTPVPSASPPLHSSLSESVEDYLKTIFRLAAIEGERGVRPKVVADHLGVTTASVSTALRRLAASDLITRDEAQRIYLTAEGQRQARRVVRRHRLIETFLVEVLDVPWHEVHDEAERLEHALSDRLEDRIAALLGDPVTDPHGDPIPPREGSHDERWGPSLADGEPGTRFQVTRVSDRDAGALAHMGAMGILPGVVLDVVRRDPFDGPLWVAIDGHELPLGARLAGMIHGQASS